MLTQAEITEIERGSALYSHDIRKLLTTVKEYQQRDKEQRFLLNQCFFIIRHDTKQPWPKFVKRIEQALK